MPSSTKSLPVSFANPDLVQRRQQLLGARELAARQPGDVDIAPRPVVEALMDVQLASDRRDLRELGALEPLALHAPHHFDKHGAQLVCVTRGVLSSESAVAAERRLAANDRKLGRSTSKGSSSGGPRLFNTLTRTRSTPPARKLIRRVAVAVGARTGRSSIAVGPATSPGAGTDGRF